MLHGKRPMKEILKPPKGRIIIKLEVNGKFVKNEWFKAELKETFL